MKLFAKIMALVVALSLVLSMAAFAEPTTYIVGTNPEFPPFESVGDDGQVVGIDVDIINAVLKAVDPECVVQIESLDFDALVPSLVSGKIDIAIAGMTADEERKQSVDFSDPYFDAVQAVIVPEGSAIATAADLDGKKIGVQLGTTGDLFVTDAYPNAEINRFNKGLDAVQDVVSGRLDCVVIDSAPAKVFAAEAGLKVLDEDLNSGNEQYGIAIAKGNEELLGKINEALAALKADGTLDSIIAKYQAEPTADGEDAPEPAEDQTKTK